MASNHPDLEAEQAYVDLAHDWLDAARRKAAAVVDAFEISRGGTMQARLELEAMTDGAMARLTRLEIGARSLVFGRIDLEGGKERFYIGRVGVWDADSTTVVVDWRAPVAEAFYRATGVEPLGLERRRRFISRGRILLGVEEEFFGKQAAAGFGLIVSRLGGENPEQMVGPGGGGSGVACGSGVEAVPGGSGVEAVPGGSAVEAVPGGSGVETVTRRFGCWCGSRSGSGWFQCFGGCFGSAAYRPAR